MEAAAAGLGDDVDLTCAGAAELRIVCALRKTLNSAIASMLG